MKLLILIIYLLFFTPLWASPISILYVDEKTEKKTGEWPISRKYYADALKVLKKDHSPKIIVLKFFLDTPKPEDKILINELKTTNNVFSQALASNEETPWKGKLPLVSLGKNLFGYEDFNSGWFPSGPLAESFKGIGLVNGHDDGFYIVNSIQGTLYASLPLMLAHEWLNKKPAIDFTKLKKDGSLDFPAFSKPIPWKTYSFIDLLDGKIPKNNFKDKIVFIYYNGKKASPVVLKSGIKTDQAQIVALMTDYLINLKP